MSHLPKSFLILGILLFILLIINGLLLSIFFKNPVRIENKISNAKIDEKNSQEVFKSLLAADKNNPTKSKITPFTILFRDETIPETENEIRTFPIRLISSGSDEEKSTITVGVDRKRLEQYPPQEATTLLNNLILNYFLSINRTDLSAEQRFELTDKYIKKFQKDESYPFQISIK